MKKSIISILLVIVMVLTLTACVDNTGTQTETTEVELIATAESTEETTTPTKPTTALPEKFLWVDEIWTMSQEEVSTYLADLVHISETRALSSEEMYQLGSYFADIWWYKEVCYHGEVDFNFNMEEFETQSYKAFNNIYEQAIEQNIPLNELYSWTWFPAADMLCKYFSSDNFSETMNISCKVFSELSEEDAYLVAKAVFENPLFASNFEIATDALYSTCTEVQEMGWAHLVTLSKSSNPELVDYTEELCHELLWECFDDDGEQLLEVIKNIMDNPNFDFVIKYTFFSTYGWDDNIHDQAIENLFELAENADEETAKLIEQVANEMYYYDNETANELLETLKH